MLYGVQLGCGVVEKAGLRSCEVAITTDGGLLSGVDLQTVSYGGCAICVRPFRRSEGQGRWVPKVHGFCLHFKVGKTKRSFSCRHAPHDIR